MLPPAWHTSLLSYGASVAGLTAFTTQKSMRISKAPGGLIAVQEMRHVLNARRPFLRAPLPADGIAMSLYCHVLSHVLSTMIAISLTCNSFFRSSTDSVPALYVHIAQLWFSAALKLLQMELSGLEMQKARRQSPKHHFLSLPLYQANRCALV